MSEQGTRSPETGGVLRRALRWWALTGVFLLGLVIGAVTIALLAGRTPVPPSAAPGAAGTSAPGGPAAATPGSPAGVTGELAVNAACLRAINAAQDTVEVVDDIGEAIAEINAARLDEVVRRLQPLQERLQVNIEDCQVVGQLPTRSPGEGPAAPGSPGASEAPASPTD
ncbi:hypothetical protein GCU60_17535 [Blastococcus saxobsidens]|uniref:Uncharacterized protein n=1 Tax=Blastococcus saxobsidens TaxID=138336 RepID=A0A6L9W611_9ACTN|nr:hypothetical protein [Blastococcus saxobsidens]NEK87546.1 hypothetical protein [Blastococcus saxobsidens]